MIDTASLCPRHGNPEAMDAGEPCPECVREAREAEGKSMTLIPTMPKDTSHAPTPKADISPWSKQNPQLQTAWDATSLRALMACPYRYYLSIVEGWRLAGPRIDLDFGILYHAALAEGMKVWAAGGTRDEAQDASLAYAINHSGHWDGEQTFIPWGGAYTLQWRCKGEKPYKNDKGNTAKCPYSHKLAGDYKWFLSFPEVPDKCPGCGGGVHSEARWVPENKNKDRYTLVRAVVWYWEEQPETATQGLQIVRFPDGRPAVELSFRIPSGVQNTYGEDIILCGHIDRMTQLGEGEYAHVFFNDYKTTKKALNKSYFSQYTPDVQMDHYDLSVSIMFPTLKPRGGMVEGAQLLVGGARFASKPLYRTEAMREEYMEDLIYWLEQAERYAQEGRWPKNRASCALCQFKGVCALPPGETRERALKAEYVKDPWNPLEAR